MEIVDNAIILLIPGAMEAGLGDVLFWGSLAFALAVAGLFAFPVNRWLLEARQGPRRRPRDRHPRRTADPARGGHLRIAAALFGTAVLIAELSRRPPD